MVKTLLKSVREFKKLSIITPLIIIAEVILEMFLPFITGRLIDEGVEVGNMQMIIRYGVILFVMALLSLAAGAGAAITGAKASTGFAKNLRRDMYHKVQDYSFANIDKFSTSSLVTRLTTDVTNVQNAYQIVLRMAVRSPIMLVFALIMSFSVNPRVAWVFLLAIPILGTCLPLLLTRAHPIFKRIFRRYDKLNLVVQENLRGIRVVKSFVREGHEKEKFDDISESIYQDFSKAEKIMAFTGPLMSFCIYLIIILVSWLSAKFIIGGTMTTGDLTTLISYAGNILMGLMFISVSIMMMVISRPSMERITEILTEEPTIKDPENPVTAVKDGSVSFKNVTLMYSRKAEKPVLDNISIDIASGETVGIIGGTGSSKSSLVQLIPRLYDVIEGSVQVGGVDVRDYHIETLRNEVAMVLQKNVLFSGTIKENLRWGNEHATDEELVRVCKLAQADGFIQSFPDGYDTYIEQGGANVSGGQKQRLCIARALLKKPKILILDDSTSAVDTRTDALIRKAMLEEIPNTTKIIIAQRTSSVQDADKIIVLDEGRVSAVGSHEELLKTSAIYQEVYYSQNREEAFGSAEE
ncbi:MAG: ABC transporter ATP-binding protein [Oscillospiraceae bacterium]|nr:ABC transporter ATP-binding protein [Oscillospiraceae bacterium]